MGKSRMVMGLSETLQYQGILENWRIICFDVTGIWKKLSSIPYYLQLKKLQKVKTPQHSIIYDISHLLPSEQKQFVEYALLDLWNSNLDKTPDFWTLCIFEESQLYARRVRSNVAEQLQRIFSVGANHKIRSLAITPTLTGIDPEFTRLCNQRYHFKLGNEQNIKRKFKSYYGSDWVRVALKLDVGFFIYYLNGRLEVRHVKLYESETKPKQLRFKQKTQKITQNPYKVGLLGRIFFPFAQTELNQIHKKQQRVTREINNNITDDALEEEEDFILIIEDEDL